MNEVDNLYKNARERLSHKEYDQPPSLQAGGWLVPKKMRVEGANLKWWKKTIGGYTSLNFDRL